MTDLEIAIYGGVIAGIVGGLVVLLIQRWFDNQKEAPRLLITVGNGPAGLVDGKPLSPTILVTVVCKGTFLIRMDLVQLHVFHDRNPHVYPLTDLSVAARKGQEKLKITHYELQPRDTLKFLANIKEALEDISTKTEHNQEWAWLQIWDEKTNTQYTSQPFHLSIPQRLPNELPLVVPAAANSSLPLPAGTTSQAGV